MSVIADYYVMDKSMDIELLAKQGLLEITPEIAQMLTEGKAARESKAKEKLEQGDYHGYLQMFNRNEGLQRLHDITQHNLLVMGEVDEWAALVRYAWEMTDNCSVYKSEWCEILHELEPEHFMRPDEIKYLKSLPTRVTLYRGYCEETGDPDGISWTPDLEAAEFFSRYRTGKPAIAKKVVGRKSIFAFIFARSEEGECDPNSAKEPEALLLPDCW